MPKLQALLSTFCILIDLGPIEADKKMSQPVLSIKNIKYQTQKRLCHMTVVFRGGPLTSVVVDCENNQLTADIIGKCGLSPRIWTCLIPDTNRFCEL